MKFLKTLGIILLIIIIIPLIAALFVKKEYSVEKEVQINLPRDSVFSFVVMLKNQKQYSVWNNMDPEMKSVFRGTDGTIGFVSAWESDNKNVGKGEQEIVGILPGERIDYKLRFKEPFETESDAWMETEAAGDSLTTVHWGFSGRMSYPFNVMMLFMDMEDAVGKDYETGLKNLKDFMEKGSR